MHLLFITGEKDPAKVKNDVFHGYKYNKNSVGAGFAGCPGNIQTYESRYKHPFPRHSARNGRLLLRLRSLRLLRRDRRGAPDGRTRRLLPRVHLHRALLHRRNDHPPDYRNLHGRREVPLPGDRLRVRRADAHQRRIHHLLALARGAGHRARRLRTGADHGLRGHGGDLVDAFQSDSQELRRRLLLRSTRRDSPARSRRCSSSSSRRWPPWRGSGASCFTYGEHSRRISSQEA